jgi:hypothetical protein
LRSRDGIREAGKDEPTESDMTEAHERVAGEAGRISAFMKATGEEGRGAD